MTKITSLLLMLAAVFPLSASARFDTVETYIGSIGGFINGTVIPLLIAIAFLVFVYGVFQYFFFSDDDDNRKSGQNLMLWAVIGFVLIASVWGIVNLLSSGLGLDNTDQIETLPDTPLFE